MLEGDKSHQDESLEVHWEQSRLQSKMEWEELTSVRRCEILAEFKGRPGVLRFMGLQRVGHD